MSNDYWKERWKIAADKEPQLNEEKELELLVKTIEESSKHCRNMLFILVVSSVYILLAAYFGGSGTSDNELTLPILLSKVPITAFFVISPIITLTVYLYLHLYVSDLNHRLEVFDGLKIETSIGRHLLLYPWLFVFAVNETKSPDSPSRYVRWISWFFLRLLGPLVLFSLWVRFVGQEQDISLIPCVCLIVAMFVANSSSRAQNVITVLVSIFFLMVTAASVPGSRTALGLDSFWGFLLDFTTRSQDALPWWILGSLSGFTFILLDDSDLSKVAMKLGITPNQALWIGRLLLVFAAVLVFFIMSALIR